MKKLSIDWPIVAVTLALAVVGILIVRSAEQGSGGAPGLWTRQALWVALGVVAMMVAASLPSRVSQTFAWPLYLLALGLLVVVLPLGHLAGGARRWFTVRGLNVQPSELAKVATVVLVSHLLTARKARGRPAKQMGLALAVATPPFFLVAAEPDLATSVVFVSVALAMTWWAGVNSATLFCLVAPIVSMACAFSAVSWGVFLLVTLAVLVLSRTPFRRATVVVLASLATGAATPLAWNALEDYQKERLLTFVDPSRDPKGAGWNTIQSKIALGSGGTWGKGYLKGTQKKLAFLPARHTDFVFSVVGEESGAVGSVTVLCLYLTLCWRLLSLASRTRNEYAALVAFGVAVMLAFHVTVNVAMVTGLFPVAGLPLPLLSYGGSFTGTTFLGIGLALQAGARRTRR